jgi:DICT domain-containing protein
VNKQATLSIGDVARRTGVAVPTLRMWEARFGFPVPARSTRGHRRYSERDCALVLDVVRARQSGLSLEASVARVRRESQRLEPSLFAGLRRQHGDLPAMLFPKPIMLALTRAIEDECCARAERAILFGSFQHERFYRASEGRWRELARTAEVALAFADFGGVRPPGSAPHEVHLDADSPLLREWAIVCAARNFTACLVGWERPGRTSLADSRREFEAVWTVDPGVVHDAARICVALAANAAPKLASIAAGRLADELPSSTEALRGAAALTSRMIAYVAQAQGPGRRPGARDDST